jgi:hypothetical protein
VLDEGVCNQLSALRSENEQTMTFNYRRRTGSFEVRDDWLIIQARSRDGFAFVGEKIRLQVVTRISSSIYSSTTATSNA